LEFLLFFDFFASFSGSDPPEGGQFLSRETIFGQAGSRFRVVNQAEFAKLRA
jgi:hypothetical protein